jgi:signal transduction histidine kinase
MMVVAMKRGAFLLSLVAGLLVAALAIVGNINLGSRPAIPGLQNAAPAADKLDTSKVLTVFGYPVSVRDDIDYVLAGREVGNRVEYEVRRAGVVVAVEAHLVPYYKNSDVIFLACGLFCFIMGFVVFALRSSDPAARIFYALGLAFGSAVMINGDLYGLSGRFIPLIPGVLFNFAFPVAPALLLRFARTFSPRNLKSPIRFLLVLGLSIVFGVALNVTYLGGVLGHSFGTFQARYQFFPVFRLFVILVCLASGVELVRSFRASVSDEVRAQIKWVFSGLVVGLSGFLFLYELPMALGHLPLVPEDIGSAFFIVIPAATAIAILKYRLMHINLVINRSLVYSLLTVLIVGVYLVSVEVLRLVFVRSNGLAGTSWVSLGAAVLAAVAFNPGRKRIQLLVDRTFFRQTYDYRKALVDFSQKARKFLDPGELMKVFEDTVGEALPIEDLGLLVFEGLGAGDLRITHSLGLTQDRAASVASLVPPGAKTLAREDAVRTDRGLDFSRGPGLRDLGLDLVVPIPFGRPGLGGLVAAGPKKSGSRFTSEDLDLLEALASELASGLERIRLEEEFLCEKASREKADELSRLKTEFISAVSHELRTPMTSLQNLSELLESGKVKDKAKRERLLHLMAAECGRLSRLVHNVLDFGRIERGVKEYTLRPGALQPVIQEVADLARSGIAPEDLSLTVDMPREPVVVDMDEDAVRQALLNLVDNAVKYSPGKKTIALRLVEGREEVAVRVEDRGIGIAPENRERIFEAFFRSPRAVEYNAKGVGLGLKIVKHIMDGHGGRVDVESEPGAGSAFSLVFPKPGRSTE